MPVLSDENRRNNSYSKPNADSAHLNSYEKEIYDHNNKLHQYGKEI